MSSSTQDEISFVLRQFLLRSSVTTHESNDDARNSMSKTALPDGISAYKGSSAANVSSLSVAASENETDDFDCESEEEEVPTPPKSIRSRSSSKRNRAAEVHNLSEKRRRSRINEKLKALQNLIPNSNKTDKASMLDEAIEYLKQLHLKVQMLSMRNGLSLHTMFFQEGLQPLQLSQVPRMDSGEESRLIPSNPTASLPMHQENPMHYLSNLPNKLAMADQQSVPTPSYIINSETSFRLESPIPENIRSFQLRRFPEMCREDILQHQHLNANH
ncbi:hypothetical protein AAZX31_17G165400 [Glycine max]|uniref:BHLH domain-containing protein n=2 Tax=Glycine subgen. Soja TaxID=1462606 RepID=K7MM49_SOYBN|nr:transcription factor SPATULA isoform X1 [Glycine max]XP_028210029.1 transcription factor SPATULA-like isoform X1 [Glycine soja]KAG4930755.1 hypothetical protein JHK86_047716 [Glycine max]KAG5102769.1 hypothetical protein JHK84_047738 [Glycine max]KAH1118854.1 hypothetical protein GYH30_047583 [Glycine max]KRH04595.1 hypothetical protein GLYMA_17G172400v4 [Glycine max]RZB57304.1 Transcription factor SPATULA isoform A [Glycine soja]|eukprot:XP_006600959.1 transcription factor SPATULA isoform X1 [Glycine max]